MNGDGQSLTFVSFNFSLINATVTPSMESGYTKVIYLLTIIFICIFVVGIVGNFLVISVLLKDKQMRNMFNFYFVSLSVADLMIILRLPIAIYELYFGIEWTLGNILCKLNSFTERFAVNVYYLTMLAIGVERFVVVVLPFKARTYCTKRTICIITCAIWSICFASSFPLIVYSHVRTEQQIRPFGNETVSVTICRSITKRLKWFYYFHISTFYAVPTIALSVIYFIITKTVHAGEVANSFGNNTNSRRICRQPSDTRNQLLVLMVVVVITNFVCLLPFNTIIVVAQSSPYTLAKMSEETLTILLMTSRVLYFISACINPIIYNLISSKFRAAFCRLLGIERKEANSSSKSMDVNSAGSDRRVDSKKYEYQSLATETVVVRYSLLKETELNED